MNNEANILTPLVNAIWNYCKWTYDVLFGKDTFNFNNTPGIVDLEEPYYLIYFNGLLLVPEIHYTIENKTTVKLAGWTSNDTADILHIVGFRPLSPDNSIQGGS